jgi:hypothetical protein
MKKTKSFLLPKARSYMQRRVNEYPTRQRFLIVCEGKKTEPHYFEKFRVPSLVVNIEGLGMNTLRLVQETLELQKQNEYDQTWCVFDKDDFPDKNFNDAMALAKKNGIKVAYSNQSFELWYVLHFCYMHTAITRADYMKMLDEKLEHEYKKNSETIFDELRQHQATAIKNAKKLLSQYNPSKPAKDDPSTTVHKLVEQLLEFSKPFGT